MIKTDKSKLTSKLEALVKDHGLPTSPDVLMVDGMFLLHRMTQVPQKFGDIALQVLRWITTDYKRRPIAAKQIYLLFDCYKASSIKDAEHALRENTTENYVITGEKLLFFMYKCKS